MPELCASARAERNVTSYHFPDSPLGPRSLFGYDITPVIFTARWGPATIRRVRVNTMKNLFLTIVFALAVLPAAVSQAQMLCDNCPDAGQSTTNTWIVMTIAG